MRFKSVLYYYYYLLLLLLTHPKQVVGQAAQQVVAEVQLLERGQSGSKVRAPADQVGQAGDPIERHVDGDDGAVRDQDRAPLRPPA